MLALLAIVMCGSVLVIGRLSSGASVDLTKLSMSVLKLQDDPSHTMSDQTEDHSQNDLLLDSKKTVSDPSVPQITAIPRPAAGSFTLTLGGSICLSGEVRKNSWNTDSKVADYADVMMLLRPRIQSDINVVFMENILSDRYKASDTVAPESAATILREGGFGMAACGFAQSYTNGKDGIEGTIAALSRQGIDTAGIRSDDDSGIPEVKNVNGVRAAILQFTATISSKMRKSMEKEETLGMVPEADIALITEEIDTVRAQGAEVVVVLVNWGKTGKEPDKTQHKLAEDIALAGADLIVGNGSHVPQSAEYIIGQNGKSVLCVWSLGTLLSGDRSSIKRMSGYLLHVTVRSNGQGGADILNPEYTPVYTWKYKQDGRFYYRCIASNDDAPDGMDNDQQKTMKKSQETVANALMNSPLTIR